jgi:plasmid stability protein
VDPKWIHWIHSGGAVPINLSVKNVPDALAGRLRARAERNRRSLQRELLSILEAAVDDRAPAAPLAPAPPRTLSIEEAAARARKLFPQGTESSVSYIRAMRDSR